MLILEETGANGYRWVTPQPYQMTGPSCTSEEIPVA